MENTPLGPIRNAYVEKKEIADACTLSVAIRRPRQLKTEIHSQGKTFLFSLSL